MSNQQEQTTARLDAVIVGAGAAGLYALHRLRGLGLAVKIVEAGTGVGGTWFWNRYPGARCDVESIEYSYSFSRELEQEWSWSERYASQPEILRYLEHVADRFDLRRDIQLSTRVTSAVFDEAKSRWILETDRGDRIDAAFCVMATGCLSAWRVPEIPGRDTFRGPQHHTAQWPHEGVDFTGQRVGVIGTGSSGIQSIPLIAEQAAHTYVFQRTPNFSIPARNAPLTAEYMQQIKSRYPEFRSDARASFGGLAYPVSTRSALEVTPEEREQELRRRWEEGGLGFMGAFADMLATQEANEAAAQFIRDRIREIVRDPAVAEALLPTDHPVGSKRICVDTGYYATFNRPNVTLVDLRKAPIETITPTGIRTADAEYELDSIVFATGFDAMTGALLNIDIRGPGGLPLREKWAGGPRTYLGLAIAGFPNLFIITGPGSPSVLSNMMLSIEQHVDWIADCLAYLRERGIARIEATVEAEDAWVAHVNEVAQMSLFPQGASWYIGANIPGKPRVFMPYIGGVGPYRQKCDEVAATGYAGFTLAPAAAPPPDALQRAG